MRPPAAFTFRLDAPPADPTTRRVINSAGLSPVDSGRTHPAEAVERFLSRGDLD